MLNTQSIITESAFLFNSITCFYSIDNEKKLFGFMKSLYNISEQSSSSSSTEPG